MNRNPTFQEQYDKIIKAYLKNTLHPFSSCACFIGNLLNGQDGWARTRGFASSKPKEFIATISKFATPIEIMAAEACVRQESNYFYTLQEIYALESHFLTTLCQNAVPTPGLTIYFLNRYTEDDLFNAMESTLIKLRELHESKGEVVQNYTFTKRKLQFN